MHASASQLEPVSNALLASALAVIGLDQTSWKRLEGKGKPFGSSKRLSLIIPKPALPRSGSENSTILTSAPVPTLIAVLS